MRLIDADALKDNMFSYAAPEMVWDRGDIEHKINEIPTIDAIPVEWLQGIRDILHRSSSRAAGDMLNRVIEMWQEEREAQDG